MGPFFGAVRTDVYRVRCSMLVCAVEGLVPSSSAPRSSCGLFLAPFALMCTESGAPCSCAQWKGSCLLLLRRALHAAFFLAPFALMCTESGAPCSCAQWKGSCLLLLRRALHAAFFWR